MGTQNNNPNTATEQFWGWDVERVQASFSEDYYQIEWLLRLIKKLKLGPK
jgi:hypothetical protein